MFIVQLKDITKYFGALCVFDHLSLTVSHREVMAVIGRSGSGKSTMLRCINGLERIQGGTIHVGGHTIDLRSPTLLIASRRRNGIPKLQSFPASFSW